MKALHVYVLVFSLVLGCQICKADRNGQTWLESGANWHVVAVIVNSPTLTPMWSAQGPFLFVLLCNGGGGRMLMMFKNSSKPCTWQQQRWGEGNQTGEIYFILAAMLS